MPSHGVAKVIAVRTIGDARVQLTAVLMCGCTITREVAADRVLEEGGQKLAVGKYPCPVGHPVVG